ncbi:MAG: FkbM family methyltransferase [Lachnospiraceae bacterium]|nr:FkbM family methyltransferase [Lachnospiraceae bacterium]
MNHTRELLLKLRNAIQSGALPVENVPLADIRQCVYAELQVNRSTFTESQYVDVLNRFDALCANIAEGETDRDKILLVMDAFILCVDMLSQSVYALANREYWNYKRRADKDDPQVAEIIDYIDKKGRIDLISYGFVEEYQALPVAVEWDENCGMRYVPYRGRKMFFPRAWDENRIASYYRSVVMEQDKRSPHCYDKESYGVNEGDVVVDAGAAEGIFALDCVDRAARIYLIEADPEWIEALEQTFCGDGDKVQIVYGFLDRFHEGSHVSLDGLFETEEINYIKMDIEGAEKAALEGAAGMLERCENIRCAICSYHCREDEESIRRTLESHGFTTDTSRGYMCPNWTLEAYLEAQLRRGIVFGRKSRA